MSKRVYPKLTAAQVLDHLEAKITREPVGLPSRWVFFREVRMGTGFSPGYYRTGRLRYPVDQRLDAWAMGSWPSGKFVRKAFEVKVGRSDFQREMKHPEKREAAFLVAEQFYFVTPEYMVDRGEVPEDCGLIWIKADGTVRTVVAAPERMVEPLDQRFMLSLLRQASRTILGLRGRLGS